MEIVAGLCNVEYVLFVTFQSRCFAWWQAFTCISHSSSGLLASPPRSCDCLDGDHVTAVVHRRWGGARTPGRGSWPVVLF